MSKVNMAVNIAGVEWKNPITVASGTFGSGMEYSEFVDLNRLGAVTTKGVANVPWPGNPTPRIAETYGGMMNAIGLQNPGIDTFIKRDLPFLAKYDTKVIVNVCGKSKEDYIDVVERLADTDIDMLEMNVSCLQERNFLERKQWKKHGRKVQRDLQPGAATWPIQHLPAGNLCVKRCMIQVCGTYIHRLNFR